VSAMQASHAACAVGYQLSFSKMNSVAKTRGEIAASKSRTPRTCVRFLDWRKRTPRTVDDKWANEFTEVRSLLFIHVMKAGHKECGTGVLVQASDSMIPFKNSLHVIASGPFYYRHGAARRRKCLRMVCVEPLRVNTLDAL
jgi:hypothetical protein